MLTLAAVQVQNYAGGRGAEYVAKLFSGIKEHMPAGVEYRCICLTDDPGTVPRDIDIRFVEDGLVGWWAKLNLFKLGVFNAGDRIVYFDLDTIILGDLSAFANYRGEFAALRDPFTEQGINSSLMAWEAGRFDHIWTKWDEAGRPQFDPHGDQNWIGQMLGVEPDYWQKIAPRQAVSFKKDCWLQGKIPKGARVLYFHGHPRCHECRAGFVRELWNREPLHVAAA